MKKYILILIAAVIGSMVFSDTVSAQRTKKESVTMHGTISDSFGVLPGATIYLLNADERIVAGEVTGVQGEYIITVPSKSDNLTIVVSFVGYKTQKTPYRGQTEFNATLLDDTQALQAAAVEATQTVTNHMGVDKKNLGVASETIDITQLEDMSATSVEDMLQGRVANLDIVSGSGDPGTASTIRIRGTASLNASNEPLIVIDGIPQDTEIDEDFDFGDADVENFGALLNISPNDIQSIEVLKDAAATALWGSQAANGVLLITTKQGSMHAPRFSFTQKFNYTFEPARIETLNGEEYVTLMQDEMWNWIKDGDFMASRVNKLTNQKDILFDQSYEYFDEFNCDTDWLGLITKSSLNSTTDFSMDGGGEMANYRFSLGYEDQDSTTKGSDYQRITSRLNLTIKFSNKFRVESRFNYTESTRNLPYGTSSELSSDIFTTTDQVKKPVRNSAFIKMPNLSPWVLDDDGNVTEEYFSAPESSLQGAFPNTLAQVLESYNRTRTRAIGATFGFNWKPFKGFTVVTDLSYNLQTVRNNSFLPSSVMNVKWADQSYNQGVEAQSNKATTYANIRLTYNRTFAQKHTVVATFSDQLNASNNNNYSVTTSGSGDQTLSSPISNGKIISMKSGYSRNRSVGLVGNFNYVYDNRYSINIAGRMNANSNVGGNDRWTKIRPSISAVWRVNNEAWLKDNDNVDDLRVRASWGRSDRTPNSSYTQGTFGSETEYIDLSSIKLSKIQLDNLRPEVVTQLNFGIDGAFQRNKYTFSFDVYSKETTDLLMQNMNIQSSTGFGTIRWYNSGSIMNKGWEFTMSLNKIVKTKDFSLSFSNINISRNVNQITELPENMIAEKYTLSNGNYARKIMQGRPVGAIYGYIFEGIYQDYDETLARDEKGEYIHDINGDQVPMRVGGTTRMHPGDAKYRDINHDGVIDEHDIVYLGSSYPSITGGGAIVLNWKGWQLRTSLHYRLGQHVVNSTRHDLEGMKNANNQSKTVLTRWRYEGDDTEIPRALWGTNYNSLGSSKFVENSSFFKIKDVTLRYNLPRKFYEKLGVSKASAYITTYNLVTFTKYTGQDPEISVGSGAYGLAIDSSRTPPSRRVALGLSVDF